MPKTWVNFAEVRARVSLEDVIVRYYGITTLKRRGDKLVGPCPVHGGDSPRAFHADIAKNAWHCFSQCGRGGNQIDFVMLREGISVREAALRLQAHFLSDGAQPEAPPSVAPAAGQSPPATPPVNLPVAPLGAAPARPDANPPLDLTLRLKGDHPHLTEDRGLAAETIRAFGLGYCSRGILRGCIAIPIHDEHGALVAYAGRRLRASDIRERGKYKFPTGFRKEVVLYNWHRAKELASERGVIVVEGFFSVHALFEAGFPNTVAVMGCELSEWQAELLDAAREVVILFDGNAAGRVGAERARELLTPRTRVRLIHLPAEAEPEDLGVRGLRWAINGVQALDLTEVRLSSGSDEPGPTNGSSAL